MHVMIAPDPDAPPVPVLGLLAAIVESGRAAPTPGELAELAGMEVDELLDLAAEADALGWACPWPEGEDGPAVTLSVRGASYLGVILDPRTGSWVHPDDERPERIYTGGGAATDGGAALADLADRRAVDPALAAEATDSVLTWLSRISDRSGALRGDPEALRRRETPPKPGILVGVGIPWERRLEVRRGRPCHVCGKRPLSTSAVCLGCLATGLDPYLPDPGPEPKTPDDAPPPRFPGRGPSRKKRPKATAPRAARRAPA